MFDETQLIQTEIENTLKIEPVNEEVVVLYKGEKHSADQKDRKVVEMSKSRPLWFSKNLIQKSTKTAEAKDDLKSIS